MILTPHILTGVFVGSKVKNPLFGAILALISHYILDSLPHWEYKFIKNWRHFQKRKLSPSDLEKIKLSIIGSFKVIIDLSVGFFLISLIFLYFKSFSLKNMIFIYIFAFLSIIPDILIFLYWLMPKNYFLKKHYKFHYLIHFPKKKNLKIQKFGFLIELILIIFILFFI